MFYNCIWFLLIVLFVFIASSLLTTSSASPHTHRPARAPKYPRKSLVRTTALDAYTVIKSPLTSGMSVS